MTRGQVCPKAARLTDEDYRTIVATSVRRLSAKNGLARLALDVGCDEKTMYRAREKKGSLSGATLWNTLAVDQTALDELAAHFGMKMVPLESSSAADTRLLADIAGLGATLAEALADGIVDHREEQAFADKARPIAGILAARVAVADRKRAA